MTKTLEQFKIDTLGNSFGKPRLDFVGDDYYVGECVSFVRLFMEEVDDIKSQTIGHALSYWGSPYMARFYDQVKDGSRKDGDILVWGDDPGSWTGAEGHIAVSYGGKLLNQNYGGSGKVTINDFFSPGYLGALRKKGALEVIPDKIHLDALYRAFRGRESTEQEQKQFIGTTTYNQLVEALDDGDERQTIIDTLHIGRYAVRDNWERQIYDRNDKIAQLEKQLADEGKQLAPGKYTVK